MSDPLVRLLLGGGGAGSGVLPVLGGTCTAWDGVTYANTVSASTGTYTDLPVVNPAAMSTGRVLLLVGPAGPIILGRLYQAT